MLNRFGIGYQLIPNTENSFVLEGEILNSEFNVQTVDQQICAVTTPGGPWIAVGMHCAGGQITRILRDTTGFVFYFEK